jgi:L,D-peptidoglycan transpeptidase YkuD (ErfK/YbiS/YcfS/YnhG family)
LPAALGRGGISAAKREGDGATPRATMRALRVFWRGDRTNRRNFRLPHQAIRPGDGWCDSPDHPRYNRLVRLPFSASHEEMHRADPLYDLVVELDWNIRPAIRRRGSAIFMHIARPDFSPTAGCIALARRDLLWLLERLGRKDRLDVR